MYLRNCLIYVFLTNVGVHYWWFLYFICSEKDLSHFNTHVINLLLYPININTQNPLIITFIISNGKIVINYFC